MNTHADTAGTVRKARVSDRDGLLALINRAFTPEGKPLRDFQREIPYVFERDGRIVGCIGLYPYDVTVGGVTFRGAGVGQVATAPEARGQGVMSALLKAVSAAADRLDFAWLYGDRLRYGRYGWTRGGEVMLYQTFNKYLPEPADSSQVRSIDMEREFAFVREKLLAQDGFPRLTDEELRLLLSSHHYAGRRLGGAYIVTNREGDHVHCAGGDPDELAQLL
jgi:predicted N-acetyltransferase YhbS